MKHRFYLIFLPFLLLLLGCADEKQEKKQQIPTEKKTEITTPTTKSVTTSSKPVTKKSIPKEYHFKFKNLKSQASILDIKNDIYNFKNIKQPIVIVNAMSTWCPPCRGQLPHLSKLQQKFKENVFVMAILVHDDIPKEKLEKLLIAEKTLFYLSVTQEENLKFINMLAPKLGLSSEFPMPLTVVFVRGKYFTHYEGMIPEEMIESDIEQLLKKIQK
jgi:thiol-disulfide isomerase/thioredoxin